LTWSSVLSLNVHLTTSVSGDVPLTSSLEASCVQNLLKEASLMRCQTSLGWASMTADSLTEVEVGIAEDIMAVDSVWCVIGLVSLSKEVW
jgi:hypothetical protein